MYKVNYGIARRCVSELSMIKSTHQHLRNSAFELPRFDTVARGRHSLRYQGPFIWSKVGSELRNGTSPKAFKKHIRGVDLSGHVHNSSNCCDLCKFESCTFVYSFRFLVRSLIYKSCNRLVCQYVGKCPQLAS